MPCLPCLVVIKLQPPTTQLSLSMHVNMNYTPSTTHSTAFHNPPMLTRLVFEGSIPTRACFAQKTNFNTECAILNCYTTVAVTVITPKLYIIHFYSKLYPEINNDHQLVSTLL